MKIRRANIGLKKWITVLFIVVFPSLCAMGQGQRVSDTKPGYQTTSVNDIEDMDKMDINVKGLYIYFYTPKNITVSLYSILGQLITQQNVQPGTTRIKAPTRGVYILKAGDWTRRVTVNNS